MESKTIEKIRNLYNGNGNNADYILYKIEGEGKVREAGVSYCVDKAIKDHLKRGYSNRYSILESSKKHGDKYSFIIAVRFGLDKDELEHSVNNSGRQASKESYSVNVKVSAINPFELFKEIEDSYRTTLYGKEQEILGLKTLVNEKDKSLEERVKEISSLESRVRDNSTEGYNNSIEAILRGYVGGKRRDELIFSIVESYDTLKQNSDMGVFLKQSFERGKFSYFGYLNNKFSLNLKSEEELSSFLKRGEEEKVWSMTTRGKELVRLERLYKNDYSLLSHVMLSGFSEEMILSVKSVVEKNKLSEVQKSIEEYKVQFENEKKIYEEILASKSKYDKFKEISEKAEGREDQELPIVVRALQDKLKIYTPLFCGDENLQKDIGEILFSGFKDESMTFAAEASRAYSDSVAEFTVLVNSTSESIKLRNMAENISKFFMKNRVINSFVGRVTSTIVLPKCHMMKKNI